MGVSTFPLFALRFRFGAHMPVAGGLHKAVTQGYKIGSDTVQIFTKSPRQWNAAPLAPDAIRAFRRAVEKTGLYPLVAHDSYLVNLATQNPDLLEKSRNAFKSEMLRAESLGLDYLVTHMGAHTGAGAAAGMAQVSASLNWLHRELPNVRVRVALETTAGQGTTLGWKFEHLQVLLNGVTEPERVQVCLDTCHVFAAGYGIATKPEYDTTMEEFDRLIGLDRIKLFHVNDSVKGLGSRVDRHAGLGEGQIGCDAFKLLVNDPRFADRPMILETPKENADGEEMDPVNLGRLRQWQKKGKSKWKPAVS